MIILPAILEGLSILKDKTVKLIFYTNELNPKQFGDIAQKIQSYGYLAFNDEAFEKEQIKQIEELKADYEDHTKSYSQRLRNVFYLMWKKDNKDFKTHEEHYNYMMNSLLEHYKSKLD